MNTWFSLVKNRGRDTRERTCAHVELHAQKRIMVVAAAAASIVTNTGSRRDAQSAATATPPTRASSSSSPSELSVASPITAAMTASGIASRTRRERTPMRSLSMSVAPITRCARTPRAMAIETPHVNIRRLGRFRVVVERRTMHHMRRRQPVYHQGRSRRVTERSPRPDRRSGSVFGPASAAK